MKKLKIIFLTLFIITIFSMVTACTDKKAVDNMPVIAENEQLGNNQEDSSLEKNLPISKNKLQGVQQEQDKEENREDKKINVKAIGDVMLARGVAYHTKGDYTLPFKETATFLKDADITFANLECTLSTKGEKLVNKGIWLRAEPKAVEGLKYIDADIVNIANNHILDYNDPAMFETMEMLEKHDIKHIGTGKNIDEARKPAIMEVRNVEVGFLAYTDLYQYGFGIPGTNKLRYFEAKENIAGVAPLKYELIREDIQKLRDQVDLVAVSLHWGVEDSHHVPPEQRELAHKMIEDGADMILGHHPHVLQGIEIYKGKPIIYSMGNFIFDQNHKANNESMIVDMDFQNGKVSRLEVIPLQIVGKKQTVFAKRQEAAHIMGYLRELSQQLDAEVEIKENKLVFDVR